MAETEPPSTSALARGVPVVSARQMLTWLDGRNNSSFGSMIFACNNLNFTVAQGSGANGLRGMLPWRSGLPVFLNTVTRNGSDVAYRSRDRKGHRIRGVPGPGGSYVANYLADTVAPTVASRGRRQLAPPTCRSARAIRAGFSEAMDPATINSSTFELRDAANALVAGDGELQLWLARRRRSRLARRWSAAPPTP